MGKTVLIHHVIQRLLDEGTDPHRLCYISVDHPLYNGCGLQDLLEHYTEAAGADLADDGIFVFFDEIQYLKDWEIHLKSLVDGYPNVKFAASGSAAAALRLKSNESGAGRFTDFLLPPSRSMNTWISWRKEILRPWRSTGSTSAFSTI